MQDWARHTDEKQVGEALCALLRECERDRDAETLRKVLSDFFLALPDPLESKGELHIRGTERQENGRGSVNRVLTFRRNENTPGPCAGLLQERTVPRKARITLLNCSGLCCAFAETPAHTKAETIHAGRWMT